MGNTLYSYYEIDISDIWQYEREQFLEGLSSRVHAQKLLDLAQHYIIKKSEPLWGISMYDKGTDAEKAYYSRHVNEYSECYGNLEKLYLIDYFFHINGCFDYDHEVIVEYEDEAFPFLFVLKLRQYKENLYELENFLEFQLKESFNYNDDKYKDFLSIVLMDQQGFLNDNIKTLVNQFISKPHEKPKPVEMGETIINNDSPASKPQELFKHNPTVWQLALYYVYIISSKEHKRIDQIALKKKDAFVFLAKKHRVSANSFEQYFNVYDRDKIRNGEKSSEKRSFKRIRDDIEFVKDMMLSNYPKALALAESDFERISLKV